MKVLIVYAHPSEDSFTRCVRDRFIEGLTDAGHSYVISDLYKMDFRTDMSEGEYIRESACVADLPMSDDVAAEQAKINLCDVIVFIYPVFWADVPAKLKGWFDRVWTYGFAYGDNRTMKTLEKGLVICIAGNPIEQIKDTGQYESIKTAMLSDRLYDRVKEKELIVLDGTSTFNMELRKRNWDRHLRAVYEAGIGIWCN
ncbi:MAG: NAD(P)H-dependent oxidoreductase [Defluviitaleaceae bacterium]|nr:NAD(P)H-dependent oxidoreductase [Defluviitaleaceae bacterium]